MHEVELKPFVFGPSKRYVGSKNWRNYEYSLVLADKITKIRDRTYEGGMLMNTHKQVGNLDAVRKLPVLLAVFDLLSSRKISPTTLW